MSCAIRYGAILPLLLMSVSCSLLYKKEKLKFYRSNADRYIECLQQRGGKCPAPKDASTTVPPAPLSLEVLRDEIGADAASIAGDIKTNITPLHDALKMYKEYSKAEAAKRGITVEEFLEDAQSSTPLPESLEGVVSPKEFLALKQDYETVLEFTPLEHEGIALAGGALINEVTGEHLKLYTSITGYGSRGQTNPDDEEVPSLRFKREDLRRHYRKVAQATTFDAWQPTTQYAALTAKALTFKLNKDRIAKKAEDAKTGKNAKGGKDSEEDKQIKERKARIDAYEALAARSSAVGRYMKAYFRSGHFISVAVDTTTLEENLLKELKDKLSAFPGLSEKDLKNLIKRILGNLGSAEGEYILYGRIKDEAFRTRGGVKYSFPAITASIDPLADDPYTISDIDFIEVGSHIARVYWEAIGDDIAGVPGDPKSTGCLIGHLKPFKKENFELAAKQENGPKAAVEKKDEFKVTVEQFGRINEHANEVEALISVATGRVIRGISIFSLNNEAIATLIETSLGVIARKATEKVLWCRYECDGDKSVGLRFSQAGEIVEVEVGFK